MEILLQLILILLGLVMLAKGADFLVEGSSNVARKFKIPEVIIGLTIVAIGTSLPELIVSATAALNGNNNISMSNIVGSNMANLFLIISLCSIIKPLHIKKQTRFVDQPLVVILTTTILFMIKNDGIIDKEEAIFLLMSTALYILYTIVVTIYGRNINEYKSENEKEINSEKSLLEKSKVIRYITRERSKFEQKFPTGYSFLIIIIGIVLLKLGGDLTVESATSVASILGLTEKLIGVTIVAIGTSLPELITCFEATKKGEVDIAIGNIAGSQIFNLILTLGVSGYIKSITNVSGFIDDLSILIAGNLIFAIIPFLNKRHRVGRIFGMIFVGVYMAYISLQVIENLV